MKWIFRRRSIRTKSIVWMGMFVVLPLCLGLTLLNGYLRQVIRNNKMAHDRNALLQIRDNADQIIETTNYVTSMLMINSEVIGALRLINTAEDGYEFFQAKNEVSNKILELESSVLNSVGGKIAVLTENGYLIGSYNQSKTKLNYQTEEWYRNILRNGRNNTFEAELVSLFREMFVYTVKENEYFYIGRSIQDYSGKNLGILLVQLSASKIWGKYIRSVDFLNQNVLYILNENKDVLVQYNRQGEGAAANLAEEMDVQKLSRDDIVSGTLKNGYYYMAVLFESSKNVLVYAMPQKIFLEESRGVSAGILVMVAILIVFTSAIMIYFSGKLSRPLKYVTEALENSDGAIAAIPEPEHSFLEIDTFISSYNHAGRRIEELIERVKTESHLKEKAHYEMLMSQISPHFMFNTVNSIRIMAKERQDKKTELALEAFGEILHAVYRNRDGMTTLGQETALLQSYVAIMKMRFGDFFRYYNVIPTELYFYEIPAFTLQPIVENAILHGVKEIKAGQIIVSAVEYEKGFVISVFNNGRAVDPDRMEKILEAPGENKSHVTGIALYNVNQRLKMLYGESYGLMFNAQMRTGFEMLIRIPKNVVSDERHG